MYVELICVEVLEMSEDAQLENEQLRQQLALVQSDFKASEGDLRHSAAQLAVQVAAARAE